MNHHQNELRCGAKCLRMSTGETALMLAKDEETKVPSSVGNLLGVFWGPSDNYLTNSLRTGNGDRNS